MRDSLRVFMVHGVSHADDVASGPWRERWQEALLESARRAGFDEPSRIDVGFASFDAIFDDFPLDPGTIARGLWILTRDALGPPPTRAEIEALAAFETARWTAGMVIQWIENPRLREALAASVLEQWRAFAPDAVCAHSLGSLACYDAARRCLASGDDAPLRGCDLVTFGSQVAHPALRSAIGAVSPLHAPGNGPGVRQWMHLFNPRDHVFTRPLAIGDERTHSLVTAFDIPGDGLNHDGAHYLAHRVMSRRVLPAILTRGPAGPHLRDVSRRLPVA